MAVLRARKRVGAQQQLALKALTRDLAEEREVLERSGEPEAPAARLGPCDGGLGEGQRLWHLAAHPGEHRGRDEDVRGQRVVVAGVRERGLGHAQAAVVVHEVREADERLRALRARGLQTERRIDEAPGAWPVLDADGGCRRDEQPVGAA